MTSRRIIPERADQEPETVLGMNLVVAVRERRLGQPAFPKWNQADLMKMSQLGHRPSWGRKLAEPDSGPRVASDTRKIVGATARLVNRVQSLESEIVKLREVIEDREASFSTQITVLSSDSFRLTTPIAVLVEHDEDGYTATWPQIDAAGFGVSPSEALASLEERVEELYVELKEWPPEKLGPAPARWLRLLSGVIEPA